VYIYISIYIYIYIYIGIHISRRLSCFVLFSRSTLAPSATGTRAPPASTRKIISICICICISLSLYIYRYLYLYLYPAFYPFYFLLRSTLARSATGTRAPPVSTRKTRRRAKASSVAIRESRRYANSVFCNRNIDHIFLPSVCSVNTHTRVHLKISTGHTHTPTENNTPDTTPDTDTHTRQEQHPKPNV